jgi:hypothetical protein
MVNPIFPKRSVSRDAISVLEDVLEVNQLPKCYSDFLIAFNGGYPKECFLFTFGNSSQESDLNILFPLVGHEYSERLLNIIMTYKGRIPSELLPIGSDSGGNIICLTITGENRGKVYLWDHSQESENMESRNLELIADSFECFIENLKIDRLQQDK